MSGICWFSVFGLAVVVVVVVGRWGEKARLIRWGGCRLRRGHSVDVAVRVDGADRLMSWRWLVDRGGGKHEKSNIAWAEEGGAGSVESMSKEDLCGRSCVVGLSRARRQESQLKSDLACLFLEPVYRCVLAFSVRDISEFPIRYERTLAQSK